MALNVRCPDKRGEEMRSVHTVCTNVIFYYSRYRTKVNHLTTIYSFSRSSWKCPWLVPCRRGARRRLSPTPPLRSPWRRQAVALVRRRRGLAEAQRRSAARPARTPAKKAAASSSVNPATGQTSVSDTTSLTPI